MNKHLLFEAACLRRRCADCPLEEYGCSLAPADMLLKEARKHYKYMKLTPAFRVYDDIMKNEYGENYAKEFMTEKARVV